MADSLGETTFNYIKNSDLKFKITNYYGFAINLGSIK